MFTLIGNPINGNCVKWMDSDYMRSASSRNSICISVDMRYCAILAPKIVCCLSTIAVYLPQALCHKQCSSDFTARNNSLTDASIPIVIEVAKSVL